MGIDNLHNQEESVLSRINEGFCQATKTIHYKMVECPYCRNKWYDIMENAQCVKLTGKCLQCRYRPSCVTVNIELEPGLSAEDGT